MKREFTVTGMSCAACSARVEKAVKALDGAKAVSVNLLTGKMTLEGEKLSDDEIINAVTKAGYGAFKNGSKPVPEQKNILADELKRKKRVLIWSFILLVPLMYVSMGHMIGLPVPNIICLEENPANFALAQFILCLPCAVLNGGYYVRGIKALIWRSPNMDTLIALGSLASGVYSAAKLFLINTYISSGALESAILAAKGLYFESAVMILSLINLGKYMEAVSKGHTSSALEALTALAPRTAIKEIDGKEKEIPASEINVGDILIVKPGFRVSADGIITEGGASIDESALTGESVPVYKTVGERVCAATVNTDSFFKMRVDTPSSESAFSRIIKMVEQAASSKPPVARLADKAAGVFVPCVMGLALVTLIVWLCIGKEFGFALTHAIAVLVVSCPCALGLATPVAVMAGTGRGAEEGILIRDGAALENAGKTDLLVCDKTGTLTNGVLAVTGIKTYGVSEEEALKTAYALERASEHPISGAVIRCAERAGIDAQTALNVQILPGKGITGDVDGKHALCGNQTLLNEFGIEINAEELNSVAQKGETPLLLAKDGRLIALISCADTIKADSARAIKLLKQNQIKTVMLTGDNELTARAIAAKLNPDKVIAGVLPEGKAEAVKALKAGARHVTMLGDGINDAPALKTADTGIAIGAGTDVALESADIILMRSSPLDALNAIMLSRGVMKIIKQNLFWAFFYNVLMIPVAAGALNFMGVGLNPMLCAAAMSVSSLFVVSNALRLKRFKLIKPDDAEDNAKKKATDGYVPIIKKEEKQMITLKVDGMMCMHCVAHVKKALEAFEGVTAEVDLDKGEARVNAPEGVSASELIKAVTDAGYEAVQI